MYEVGNKEDGAPGVGNTPVNSRILLEVCSFEPDLAAQLPSLLGFAERAEGGGAVFLVPRHRTIIWVGNFYC